MSLSPGTRLGHYDVTALIGEGDREVAPKAPSSVLGGVNVLDDFVTRFLRLDEPWAVAMPAERFRMSKAERHPRA